MGAGHRSGVILGDGIVEGLVVGLLNLAGGTLPDGLGRVDQLPVPNGLGHLACLWLVLLGLVLDGGFFIIVFDLFVGFLFQVQRNGGSTGKGVTTGIFGHLELLGV